MKCFVQIWSHMRNLLKKCAPLTKSNQQHPSWERSRHSDNHELLDLYRTPNSISVFRRTWVPFGVRWLHVNVTQVLEVVCWLQAFRTSAEWPAHDRIDCRGPKESECEAFPMILTALTRNVRPQRYRCGPFLQTSCHGLVLQCHNCAVRNTRVSLQVMQYLPCWFDIVVWSYCAENITLLFLTDTDFWSPVAFSSMLELQLILYNNCFNLIMSGRTRPRSE
jgi:hypothetical protein